MSKPIQLFLLATAWCLPALTLYSQNDITFPEETGGVLDDTALEQS